MRPRRRRGEAQEAIIAFIIDYKCANNGISPSYREIAEHFEYKSHISAYNAVMRIIAKNRAGQPARLALDDKGRIVVPDGYFVLKSS